MVIEIRMVVIFLLEILTREGIEEPSRELEMLNILILGGSFLDMYIHKNSPRRILKIHVNFILIKSNKT